jgi:RNA-directed DNA polymerase
VDVSAMQRKLRQWATENPTEQRRELSNLLCNAVWLRGAHHSVNANQGRETAGIDGESMRHFNGNLEGNLEELRQLLKAQTFEPVPVKRVYIPKSDGKKHRPLGIPTLRDRIVQEALRMILEPIGEADVSTHSYGFRPNRSPYNAIASIGGRLTGSGSSYQWVIEGDITSYFDTIPHRRFIKAVQRKGADRDIRALLWTFLRAGVMYRGSFHATLTGTPQGGIVSPLLANIDLDPLDKYMESTYLNLSEGERRTRRTQRKGNDLSVRYADDFIMLCNGTRAEAQHIKEEVGGILTDMGLTLSEEKTKITHSTEGFIFLGYQIIRTVSGKGKMVPQVLIPEKAMQRYSQKVNEILAPNTTSESRKAKLIAMNRLTRGGCQYYCWTSTPSRVFRPLDNKLFWKMAHWLGRKYKKAMPDVMQKWFYGTKRRPLVSPKEFKAKRLRTTTWHNPYTAKEEITRERMLLYERIWSGHEHRPGSMDLREEILLRDGPICATGGNTFHPSEVQIDHKVLRKWFKNPKEADRLENVQVLCTECHRAKTKADLKVWSRMR